MKKYFLLFTALLAISACSSGGAGGDSYMPLSKGTVWTYNGSKNYTMSVGEDTTINGKKYSKVKQDSTAVLFARWDGGTLNVMSPFLGPTDLVMLKDGDKGTNWTVTAAVFGMSMTSYDTITEASLTRTVNGKEYKNVIHVRDVQKPDSTNPAPSAHDYFYAKGVGMIEDYSTGDTARLVSTASK